MWCFIMRTIRLSALLFLVVLLTGCLQPDWKEAQQDEEDLLSLATNVSVEEEPFDEELEEDIQSILEEEVTEELDLPKKEVRAGQLISFPNLKATDPDGDEILYTFSEPLDEKGEWQTQEGDEGSYKVTITASDGTSSVKQDVLLVVLPSNYAPDIEVEGTITVLEGETFDLEITVTDQDEDDVNVSYQGWQTSLPYTTTFEDAGIYTITIVATDGKKTTKKDVDIIVENVNREPTIVELDDATVTENDLITIVPTVEDLDGDEVIVSFSEPFGDEGTWQTSPGDVGVYDITIEASDGEFIVSTNFKLTVEDFDDPPVISGAEDITVTETETVQLQITAEDPEGKDVKITISGWMDSMEKETGYQDAGRYEVIILASDGTTNSTETIYVTVEDVNRAPEFNPDAFS